MHIKAHLKEEGVKTQLIVGDVIVYNRIAKSLRFYRPKARKKVVELRVGIKEKSYTGVNVDGMDVLKVIELMSALTNLNFSRVPTKNDKEKIVYVCKE